MTDVKPASVIDGAIDAEETERVADAYFAAISDHDVEAAVAMWRPGGRENVRGQVDAPRARRGARLPERDHRAVPGPRLHHRREDRAGRPRRLSLGGDAARSRDAPFQGVEPNGARLELEGTDVLIVRDGVIVENNAYADAMTVARQLGLMPPEGLQAGARR